jgi:hypothetical protein
MTSVEAGRVLRDSGISIAKRAKAVDKLSAQILLESFLSVGDSAMEYLSVSLVISHNASLIGAGRGGRHVRGGRGPVHL